MTEDQANLMQCCGPEGCGRFNDDPYPARWCVGAKCMAWRQDWVERSEMGRPVEEYPRLVPYHEAGAKLLVHGYCGLTGGPK